MKTWIGNSYQLLQSETNVCPGCPLTQLLAGCSKNWGKKSMCHMQWVWKRALVLLTVPQSMLKTAGVSLVICATETLSGREAEQTIVGPQHGITECGQSRPLYWLLKQCHGYTMVAQEWTCREKWHKYYNREPGAEWDQLSCCADLWTSQNRRAKVKLA